jgi:lysyl-tRNA synthetase class 2
VLAIAFGIGAALVLDEWALIFHLDDVYWSQEGRSSIDAVVIGSIMAGVLLYTASPFGLEESEYRGRARPSSASSQRTTSSRSAAS